MLATCRHKADWRHNASRIGGESVLNRFYSIDYVYNNQLRWSVAYIVFSINTISRQLSQRVPYQIERQLLLFIWPLWDNIHLPSHRCTLKSCEHSFRCRNGAYCLRHKQKSALPAVYVCKCVCACLSVCLCVCVCVCLLGHQKAVIK